MARPRLGDPEVQKAIRDFVAEARICAKTPRDQGVVGLGAMSLLVSCITAVGSALAEPGAGTGRQVESFFGAMPDKLSWLIPPEGRGWDEAQTSDLLVEMRHSLAHGLSLPDGVILVPNAAAAELHDRTAPRIVVPALVEAIEATVRVVATSHPERPWPVSRRKRRWRAAAVREPSLIGEGAGALLWSAPDKPGTATGLGLGDDESDDSPVIVVYGTY